MFENLNPPDTAADKPRNNARMWPVGELIKAVANILETRFNPVTVQGEISGFSRAASGHCYFSLKDAQGQVRCAMFRRAALLLDFSPTDGQIVELRGRVGVYEPRGELQLVVESLRQAGQGTLFDQFLKLKSKLEAEGLFDQSHKRALPTMPKAIGIVTSLGAAALHDVLTALQRRSPHIPLIVYPASVQGAQSANELRQALIKSYERNEVDVLLLVRGGGAIEDLWSFNDEQLARLIFASPIPVISGVGHETDFTIADFCADLRAPTPTAAAELAALPLAMLRQGLSQLATRLQRGLDRQLESSNQQLDRAALRLMLPSHFVTRQQSRLDLLAQNFQHAHRDALTSARGRLDTLAQKLPDRLSKELQKRGTALDDAQVRLELLNPQLVLRRGYAWLTDQTDRPITSASQTRAGESVRATLVDGEVDLTVAARRLI